MFFVKTSNDCNMNIAISYKLFKSIRYLHKLMKLFKEKSMYLNSK